MQLPEWLFEVAPLTFRLRAFIPSTKMQNTLILLNEMQEGCPQFYSIVKEPVAQSSFVKVYDVTDIREDRVVGHVVHHRKMESMVIGDYFVRLIRAKTSNKKMLTQWTGEYITLYEGERGCVLHNRCNHDNLATRRLDII